MPLMDISDRFYSKVNIKGDSECWMWTASTFPAGYGRFAYNGSTVGAHRFAYFLHNGRWPEKMALHSCGNKGCVNPLHIYDGDAYDNYADSINHGSSIHGEDHELSKLKPHDVRRIRSLASGQEIPNNAEIARSFGVSKNLIGLIVNRKVWRHLID